MSPKRRIVPTQYERRPKVFESIDALEHVNFMNGCTHFNDEKLQDGDVIVGRDGFCYVFPFLTPHETEGVGIDDQITDTYADPISDFSDVTGFFVKRKISIKLFISTNHDSLVRYIGEIDTRWEKICVRYSADVPVTVECHYGSGLNSLKIELHDKEINKKIRRDYLLAIEPSCAILFTTEDHDSLRDITDHLAATQVSSIYTVCTLDDDSKILLKKRERLYIILGTWSELENFKLTPICNAGQVHRTAKPDFTFFQCWGLELGTMAMKEVQIHLKDIKILKRRNLIVDIAYWLIVAGLDNYPILWIIDEFDCFKHDPHKWKIDLIFSVCESFRKVYRKREKKAKSQLILK